MSMLPAAAFGGIVSRSTDFQLNMDIWQEAKIAGGDVSVTTGLNSIPADRYSLALDGRPIVYTL